MPLALYLGIHIYRLNTMNMYMYTVKYNTHTHIHKGSHFGADTVLLHANTHHTCVGVVSGPSRLNLLSSSSFVVHDPLYPLGPAAAYVRRHCISQIAAAAADTQHSFLVKNSDLLRVTAK